MTVHVVADVHGAADALGRVAPAGSTVFVLGDLVNLIDYRTVEGIIPDIVGASTVQEVVRLRAQNRFDDAAALWRERSEGIIDDIRARTAAAMRIEYAAVAAALAPFRSYVTFGNVDDIELLEAALPPTATFVDAEVIEINGTRFGFAGGGVEAIGSAGEVSDADMESKLRQVGPVDVLCTHVPPAVEMLATDLFGPRPKGSVPIRDYIEQYQPSMHLFGDVHQPRARTMQVGETRCHNVGYFRATGRALVI